MDIMLDLETLGTKPGSVVLSIGATTFNDKHGLTGEHFHVHLSLAAQVDAGLTIDPGTVLWWLGQETNAQKAIAMGQLAAQSPEAALASFSCWYSQQGGDALWGNGSDFDLPLLAAVYHAFGMTPPWKYNAGRCCRTVMALTGKKMGAFGTVNPLAHDAHADAVYQASEISKALAHLSNFGA